MKTIPKSRSFALVVIMLAFVPLEAMDEPLVAWGDSLTYGTGAVHRHLGQKSWPLWFTEFSGVEVIKKGVGGESSIGIRDRMLAEPELHENFTVIWAGNNNYQATDKWVQRSIAQMVEVLPHQHFLIVGIINSTKNPKGSAGLQAIDTINHDLKETYGDRFVDVRAALVDAYDPNVPEDVLNHENDVPPSTLRSDVLHLNSDGYKVAAQEIFQAYTQVMQESDSEIMAKP